MSRTIIHKEKTPTVNHTQRVPMEEEMKSVPDQLWEVLRHKESIAYFDQGQPKSYKALQSMRLLDQMAACGLIEKTITKRGECGTLTTWVAPNMPMVQPNVEVVLRTLLCQFTDPLDVDESAAGSFYPYIHELGKPGKLLLEPDQEGPFIECASSAITDETQRFIDRLSQISRTKER